MISNNRLSFAIIVCLLLAKHSDLHLQSWYPKCFNFSHIPLQHITVTLNRNGLFYWIHSTMRSWHTVQPQPKGIASLTIIVWKCLKNSPKKRRSEILCNRHTDQGAIYSSQAFCQAYNYYNILRSLSRVGIQQIIQLLKLLMAGSRKNCSSTLI